MRKLLLSIAAGVLIVSAASAQEDTRALGTTTKKGQNILPAKGDIAIGVDADPFLSYLGNLFTDSYNSAPSFDARQGALFGKYFLTDKTAVRARVEFDFSSAKNTDEVDDLTSTATPPAQVNDVATYKNNDFLLAVGYELRRGYGRLQGFYGGEVAVGFGGDSDTYTYGNAITATNPGPRNTSVKNGKNSFVGLGGFAGVEYFVAPKISIGGELGLGLYFRTDKAGETTTEFWNGTAVETETVKTSSKDNYSGVFTNTSGRISVAFHF